MRGLIILILLLSTHHVYGQFRETTWGISKAEVLKIEGKEPIYEAQSNGIDQMVLQDNVGGLDASVVYAFIDDKLIRGGYFFTEDHTNDNQFISDFNSIKLILDETYEEPDSKRIWSDDLYKSDRSKWGFAISLGDYSMLDTYKTNETQITHLLSGNNYKLNHILNYVSIELEYLEKDLKKKKAKKDFK